MAKTGEKGVSHFCDMCYTKGTKKAPEGLACLVRKDDK